MNTHCFYCKKPFQPGETITSDVAENVCHLDCEDPRMERKMMGIEKQTMHLALLKLASIRDTKDKTYIEDRYCKMCTIREKIRELCDGTDSPQDLIVGVGGIYKPSKIAPGGAEPIYRVVC